MKNLGRNLKVALLSVGIITTVLVITFVYINATSSVTKLKSDISALKARHSELMEKNLKKDNYNYEIKYINYETGKLKKILPPDILQERAILSLRRVEKASGAKITSIEFSPLERVAKFGISAKDNKAQAPKPSPSPSPSPSASAGNKKAAPTPTPTPLKNNSLFADGDQLEMKAVIGFRAPYESLKQMLKEISLEENRVVIEGISIERDSENRWELLGNINLTFCALKDSKRSFADWELQLEKGIEDLFKPFDGYGKSEYEKSDKILLPEVEDKFKAHAIKSDFYLLASPFNDETPALLIGKYETVNSEIFYDGNGTIELNVYVEEKDGEYYYRTRTLQMPYPDETNTVRFFPKQEDITMDVRSAVISGDDDKVRIRLNVYNNTDKQFTIFTDDLSERVSVIVKEGKVVTSPQTAQSS